MRKEQPLTEDEIHRALLAGDESRRERLNRLYEERRRDKCGRMRCVEGPCSCWEWAKERVKN